MTITDHECRKYIGSLCWQFSCVCLSWVHCCVHCHTWETICPSDCFLAFPFSGMSRDRVGKTGWLFVYFILIFYSFLFYRFHFSFLRNVERPSSGKNRSIYYSNCHWPTQAPSIIWPNKKPFNEMRENLGNHKSKTARIIYLGAMIYLRRIYDMLHAMKSNFLKPFFCALYISFNNLQVKTAWNRHIWKTWTLISKEGDNHLPIKIHISPLLFFLTFYWQR